MHAATVLLLVLGSTLSADSWAIKGVTVVDVQEGRVLPSQTVVIENEVIQSITPSNPASDPKEAIDGTGQFLIPGLWDMHVHFASADYAPLFIANGGVGVRDMHAHLPFMLLPLRKQIEQGKKVGPRILTALTMVDGAPALWGGSITVSNADDAKKGVATLKDKGADLVKVYSGLSPDAFQAVCAEAKIAGLPVAGHVPEAVSVVDASNAGMSSMEHTFGILTAAASNEQEMRNELLASIRGVDAKTYYAMLMRALVKGIDRYDESRANEIFAVFAKNRTYQCPTLTVHRMFAQLTDPTFRSDERVRYTPALIQNVAWKQTLAWVEPIAQNSADLGRLYNHTLKMVGAMHLLGVPILAGTDTSNPYCMAGFSLHDELSLLVKAGLSPLAALQAATLEPARYMKIEGEAGTVAAGKRADLVLLDANPLENIAHTKKIRAVIVRGKLLDRAALDALLARAEKPGKER